MTDAALVEAAELEPALWGALDSVRVFARMSPQGKAQVIRQLQQRSGRKVLMCGDGGNDVGALKSADVGVSLLTGFGNANVDLKQIKGGDHADAQQEGPHPRPHPHRDRNPNRNR